MKKTGKTHVSRPALALACKKVDILSLLFLFQRGKVSRLHRTQRRERFISVYNQKGSGTYSTRKTQQQRKKTRMIANALRREARKALTGVARRRESLVRRFLFSFCDQISWHFVRDDVFSNHRILPLLLSFLLSTRSIRFTHKLTFEDSFARFFLC